MLSSDRQGRIHGQIFVQYDFPVATGVTIHRGGLYSCNAAGELIAANDDPESADKATLLALEGSAEARPSNPTRVRCMVRGIAAIARGTLTPADVGKTIHGVAEDALSLTSTNNRACGILLGVDGQLATIHLG